MDDMVSILTLACQPMSDEANERIRQFMNFWKTSMTAFGLFKLKA